MLNECIRFFNWHCVGGNVLFVVYTPPFLSWNSFEFIMNIVHEIE